MFSLEELFCNVDDFCQTFELHWRQQLFSHGLQTRARTRQLVLSEITTILISFHQQRYRTFKHYHTNHVCVYWREAFPGLVSYSPIRQLDAFGVSATVRLPQTLLWSVYWDQLYRLD